jgi:hypothetical protein
VKEIPSDFASAKVRSPAFPVDTSFAVEVADGLEARVQLVDRFEKVRVLPARLTNDVPHAIAQITVGALVEIVVCK